MRFRILLMMVLAAVMLSAQDAPAPKPVNVGGIWEVTMQTPQGDMTADATFVQENDKFKFTMPGPQGMEEMTLTYKAKVEGDLMTGEVQAGDFGAFPFTAKKKK